MVQAVRDIQIARRVHRYSGGICELRPGRRTAVPAVAPFARARHRRDRAGRVHPAHAVVPLVRDIQIARRVHRQVFGVCELGAGRRTAVPAVALLARARHCRDHAGSKAARFHVRRLPVLVDRVTARRGTEALDSHVVHASRNR